MSRCVPDGTFAIATSEDDFNRKITVATHTPGCHAIYFGRGVDEIDVELAEKASEIVNSPLSTRLLQRYDSTVYLKAAIYLFRFVRGDNKSLRHFPQDVAWDAISRLPGNPLAWLTMKGGIR